MTLAQGERLDFGHAWYLVARSSRSAAIGAAGWKMASAPRLA